MGLHPLFREFASPEQIAQAEAEAARALEETPGAGEPVAWAEVEEIELPVVSEDGLTLTYQGVVYARLDGQDDTAEPVGSEEPAPADTAESAHSEPVATEDGGQTAPVAPESQDELPARMASTAAWIEYAEQHPLDPPLDLSPRTGLRDEIAARYLSAD